MEIPTEHRRGTKDGGPTDMTRAVGICVAAAVWVAIVQ
jgi:hypothetical protein